MFQTIRLGKFFGIDLFAHWTLWPLLIYMLVGQLFVSGLAGVLAVLGLLIVLFVSVYLHELGHALTAMRLGIRTRDIILLPVGGVARFEQAVFGPRTELLISSAGPLVNLLIAIGGMLPLAIAGNLSSIGTVSIFSSSLFAQIVQINLILGISNLLPALPLDGGRMLRAVLSMRSSHLLATQKAAKVSRYIGFGLILLGPIVSWMFVLLGIFIILSSLQELWSARFRDVLETSGRDGSSPMSQVFEQFVGGASIKDPTQRRSGAGEIVDAAEVRHLSDSE